MPYAKKQIHITRLIAVLLVLAAVLALAPKARAATISGSCGSGVSWAIAGNVLQITGSGEMADYSYSNPAPWHAYRDSITELSVAEGITRIGTFAFLEMEQLKAVRLPDSVAQISSYAFYGCSGIETAYIGTGVEKLGDGAFEQCKSLKAIRLPSSLLSIGQKAFYNCISLISITVPASVYQMGDRVFAYCAGLRSAVVLASIKQLPLWSFYGCHNLTSISLASTITEVGTQAFEKCENLTDAQYGGSGAAADSLKQQIQENAPSLENFTQNENVSKEPSIQHTTTQTQESNGETVTVQTDYSANSNGKIETQTTDKTGGANVQINAVINNDDGWKDVAEKVNTAVDSKPKKLQVDVYLQNDGSVSGKDIGRFVGKDVTVTVHTQQGTSWNFVGKDIADVDSGKTYRFTYTLTPVETLSKGQQKVIGDGYAYAVVFDETVDFPVSVELRVGRTNNIATFFVPQGSDKYQQIQQVVVDSRSVATFHLRDIQAEAEYLVGIGVPVQSSDASKNEYLVPEYDTDLPVEYIDMEKYAIAGVKSSWGMDIKQVTWILAGVMGGCVVVVGIVIGVMNKQRLKKGYVPKYNEE